MGRHQNNPFRKFFIFKCESKESICNIDNCGYKLSGNHAGNMQRHVERNHYDVFQKIIEMRKQQPVDKSTKFKYDKEANGQQSIYKFVEKSTISVSITAEHVMNACVELVTINGRPFSFLEDSGFRKILYPIIKELNPRLCISIDNVKAKVSKNAKEARECLKNDLKGRLLLLKIDAVTCIDRSILGINVQYVKDSKIIIRTLAMKEMKEKHTSEYISSIILDVLKSYDLTVDMIYSITTDNAANMLKTVALLLNYQSYTEEQEMSDIDDYKDDSLQNDYFPDVVLANNHSNSIRKGIRCVAHTLQLAVADSIKEENISIAIAMGRSISKKLRTPIVRNIAKKLIQKKSIIDCPTRWHSTHDMLERLLELKPFCVDMSSSIPELQMSSDYWLKIEMIVSVLKPAKITTKLFQSENMTAGDFLGAWIKLKIDTEKCDTDFSRILLNNLKIRENLLFDSDAIITSIFLDPRYKTMLTTPQIDKARIHVLHTYHTIKKIYSTANEPTLDFKETMTPLEDDDEVEVLLKQNDKKLKLDLNFSSCSILEQFDSYRRKPRINKKGCIFKFWEEMKVDYPELYTVTVNIIAVPTTQVSVERAFSALKFILSPNRANLSEKMLEDILYLRLNN